MSNTCFIFFVKKTLSGFLSKPILSLAPEKAVSIPVEKKRCRLITLSYLPFLILFNISKRFFVLLLFLSQVIISCRYGLFASRDSLPLRTRKSIDASGRCACSFSATAVASTTSPIKAVCMISIFSTMSKVITFITQNS